MQSVDILLEPARAFLVQLGAFLPRLAVALLMLVAGWLVAKLARFAVERGLRAINFSVLTERAGMDAFLQQGGSRTDTTRIFGLLVFWLVVCATLVVVFNSLGLSYATDIMSRLVLFVPRLMLALMILVIGAYFARFVANAVQTHCQRLDIPDGDFLSMLAHYAVLAFAILMALDFSNIGGDLVRETFLIVLTGVMLAFALAFGLGGKDWAAGLLQRWWPSLRRGDGASARSELWNAETADHQRARDREKHH